MALYFFGNYKKMLRVRDEVLISQRKYVPWCIDNGRLTPRCVRSPEGIIMIEFNERSPIKVCVENKKMFGKDGTYTQEARPYLEDLVRLLQPARITDDWTRDVTTTLNIK